MRSYTDLTSRKAVFAAMAECDARGREGFLTRYGFHEAQSYVLRHEGRLYDSKPILAVAYAYQHGEAPLRADEFSGGRSAAAGRLMRLGFDIDGLSLPITDWTLAEVEPTVAVYFDMLAEQLKAGEVDPAPYLERMQAVVPTRPASAHGRKFSNINAVLQEMDVPFVAGIGRSPNAQILLRAVVTDWLDDRPEFVSPQPSQSPARDLIEEDPPKVPPKDAKAGEPRPRKTDYAARDAANRALGKAGEELALRYLEDELRAAGQDELAGEVRWVSKEQGDGLGYDITSFTPDGDPVFIEVKTTCGGKATPFFVSANEVRASLVLDESYLLMRIYDFSQAPKFYRMKGSLERSCDLRATNFSATPRG